ncbi:MAG: anti sigma factor C-terminal domain-containing protein [Lachnospiraceae bacterium]|nr:anti sigma factor C-terminal domain-containing protein [Lachnospiraceae bacterium]
MTYREMLEKYREGTLEEAQKVLLEQEIEKYEAISDYLLEDGEIPELGDVFGETGPESGMEDTAKEADGQFVALVNRSIRRAFRRLAAGVVAVTLAAVLFLQLCLPRLVSAFYYNPAGTIAEDQNQMSRDLAVYSELFWPCRKRTQVNVEEKGYGKYDISIPQTVSYTRSFTNVSGEITRGKLKLYDSNILQAPTGNCFAWFQAIGDLSRPLTEIWGDEGADSDGDGVTESYNVCAAGSREQARETLESLSDTEKYIGCVSLNQMMDYESFMEFLDTQEELSSVWCAVKTNDPVRILDEENDRAEEIFRADNIGFECDPGQSTAFVWDEDKYPGLFTWNIPLQDSSDDAQREQGFYRLDERLHSEADMRQHFVSLLTYMADQEQFLSMMEAEEGRRESLLNAADYVRENGITVYGFAAVMDKETALKLEALDEVYEIYIEDMR